MSFLQPGTVFAKDFRIVGHLSSGGMGSVFVVEQLSTGKERALKVMHTEFSSDSAHRARFESEARISASIESDHVVEVLAAGVDVESNIPWLVMELLRGDTLEGHVDRAGPMRVDELREVARQLRHVLEQAHMLGIVHRDLKPENLFLASARRQDVPFTLKVLDFGIAKWAQEVKGTLKNSQMLGSPLWMAPEQLRPGSIISPSTDVWALGLIAYFLLTGSHYWAAANTPDASITGLLIEMATEPMPPPTVRAAAFAPGATLPAGFDEWFERTTNRDAARRFESAGPCLDAFIDVLTTTSAPPAAPRPQPQSFDRETLSESSDPEMLLRIARVYELRDTDRPRAVEAYRRVLALKPSDEASQALATLLESMGRFTELCDVLTEQALRSGHEARSAALWQRVAIARRDHLGDFAGYAEAMRHAFEADPLDRTVTAHLVKSLAANALFDEIDVLLHAARSAGQRPAFLDTLAGEVAEARGDLAGAEAAYARAIASDEHHDIELLARFARSAASSGAAKEALRERWTRVLSLDIENVEAWTGILAVVPAGDESAAVADAAIAVLGDKAPEGAKPLAQAAPAKTPSMEVGRELLESLAGTPLALPEALEELLRDVPAPAPLASFGFSLKELVDPMTSSRALLTRAMPIYKQLSSAGAALDLHSTRKVYFREGGGGTLTRLHAEPAAIVIGADITSLSAEEIAFAAFEFSARMRPELDAHFRLAQLATAPTPLSLTADARAYLVGVERAAAKVGMLACGRLRAAQKPLASRACIHADAHLAGEALFRELALFIASGQYAAARKSAIDAA